MTASGTGRFLSALALSLAARALAQPNHPCPSGVSFEQERYRIAHVSVDDPFRFLYWIKGKSATLESQLSALLAGRPYTLKLVGADALALVEKGQFVPQTPGSFAVRIELVSVVDCNPAVKTLSLIYRIYSTAPPQILGATETQKSAEQFPQNVTGLATPGSPFRLLPSGGYNRAFSLFGGGVVELTPELEGVSWLKPIFDKLSIGGEGSRSTRSLSGSLSGSLDRQAWLRRIDWRLGYDNISAPANSTVLKKAEASGQASAQSRAFWNGDWMARFGGLVDGGNMQSGAPAGLLPAKTVAGSDYVSLKGYAGLSSRTSRNVFSASYGLELSSDGGFGRVDWRKHIADVVDEFWIPIGDHRPFEVESRFTAGFIQVPGAIPLAGRFFGGNGDGWFMPGDAWQIRDVPVIRAIPANRFSMTGQGIGADRFAAVNLTLSYPVKSWPVMPAELTKDPQVQGDVNGAMNTAANTLQIYYASKDPHFTAASARIPALNRAMTALHNLVDPAGDCSGNIDAAVFDAGNALTDKGVAQYGDVSALLSDGGDLAMVLSACSAIKDPAVVSATTAFDALRTAMLRDFQAVDQMAAARKGTADLAFARRTLNTLFNDLNIFSVSPVAVFDTAWIGSGNRIGPGGGVRFELASTVNFTAGYAFNLNGRPGEGKGALFFAIGIRDLFH